MLAIISLSQFFWSIMPLIPHRLLWLSIFDVSLSTISDSISNHHNDSKLLPTNNKLALLGIWTANWKKERRALIRMTYLRHRPFTIDYYFFICTPMTTIDQHWIAFENKMYQDMIIMKCIDNSHHGKIWNFLQAVHAICNRTNGNDTNTHQNITLFIDDSLSRLDDLVSSYDFIVKTDDDSFVHMINLESSLLSLHKISTYYGRFWYRNTHVPFACGMLWTLSYDLFEYLAVSIHNDSRVIYGPEDYLVAWWLKNKTMNIVDDPQKFVDYIHAESPIRGQHYHDTICIHQLKNDVHFMEIAMYYEQE